MTYGEQERNRRYKLEDEVEGQNLLPYVALRPEKVIFAAQQNHDSAYLITEIRNQEGFSQ